MHPPEEWERKIQALEARISRLLTHQENLEGRLARVENSIVFRTLRAIGTGAQTAKSKAGQILLHSPLHRHYLRFSGAAEGSAQAYRSWTETEEIPAPRSWSYEPVIGILLPIYQPNLEWLRDAIESVQSQTYANWQLSATVDGPCDALVWDYLESLSDPRIRIRKTASRAGISHTLNEAQANIGGEYLAFLDHDDVLTPYALHYVVEALQTTRAGILYSDEDHLNTQKVRCGPNLKPGWSPELLLSCMYMGHFLVVSRDLWVDFRKEYDGAQDYDFILRATSKPHKVVHIPKILYHWRQHAGSTAEAAAAKPYAQIAGRAALESATGLPVQDGDRPHTYRLLRPAHTTKLSVVICSRNGELLAHCLTSLRQTTANLEVDCVVVHHEENPTQNRVRLVAEEHGCIVVPYRKTFNFAEMNNLGAQAAMHPTLLFLNDDVRPLRQGWAELLLAQTERHDIGICGALLLYPSGAIQHAGIALGIGEGTGHPGRGEFESSLWPWLRLTRDISAVTGACLAIRKDVFDALNGFDEGFPVNYNDVDLCLRARAQGYRTIIETGAVLEHAESQSRAAGTTLAERERFYERWAAELALPDPFFHPAFDSSLERITLGKV